MMLNAATCCTKKRWVVAFVLLEVVVVLYGSARILFRFHDGYTAARVLVWSYDGSSGSSDDGVLPRIGPIGAESPHNRSDKLRTHALLVVEEAATDNHLSPTGAWPPSSEVERLVAMVPPRAFSPWNNLTLTLPCPPAEKRWLLLDVQQRTTRTGILYVKVPKTGSSTGSSVNLRLASRIYEKVVGSSSAELSSSEGNQTQQQASPFRQLPPRVCRNRFKHSPAHVLGYGRRDRLRSILWSVVRDPTDRVVSEYFHFGISRGGRNASDDSAFRDYLWEHRERLQGFQARYLAFHELAAAKNGTEDDRIEERRALHQSNSSPVPSPSPSPPRAVSLKTIRTILRGYDFVGVSERMDESLVALQLLLGLETADILYMRYAVEEERSLDARRAFLT
jgi:Sulfotransferase family